MYDLYDDDEIFDYGGELAHYGVKGMKWGVRKDRVRQAYSGAKQRVGSGAAKVRKTMSSPKAKRALKVAGAVAATTAVVGASAYLASKNGNGQRRGSVAAANVNAFRKQKVSGIRNATRGAQIKNRAADAGYTVRSRAGAAKNSANRARNNAVNKANALGVRAEVAAKKATRGAREQAGYLRDTVKYGAQFHALDAKYRAGQARSAAAGGVNRVRDRASQTRENLGRKTRSNVTKLGMQGRAVRETASGRANLARENLGRKTRSNVTKLGMQSRAARGTAAGGVNRVRDRASQTRENLGRKTRSNVTKLGMQSRSARENLGRKTRSTFTRRGKQSRNARENVGLKAISR